MAAAEENVSFRLSATDLATAASRSSCTADTSSLDMSALSSSARAPVLTGLRLASWNVAAINNNPFEYWMTHPDDRYEQIMHGMQNIIDDPREADVPVSSIFTSSMCDELLEQMQQQGWNGVEQTAELYHKDFKNRRIVSDFLRDADLGSKRLMSMPDRVTNTITAPGNVRICRPTPINAFDGDMANVEKWWPLYLDFFFVQKYQFKSGVGKVCGLLQPIRRAKYPAISPFEEAISIPLSCLCLAIFDCILVHLMYQINPDWQDVRLSICTALGSEKTEKTLRILATHYSDCHAIFLQEAAADLIGQLNAHPVLSHLYEVIPPEPLDLKRDQNSLILVKKDLLDYDAPAGPINNICPILMEKLEFLLGDAGLVSNGDIASCVVGLHGGEKLCLVSFHGDTNGLATIPVTRSVMSLLDELETQKGADSTLVIGMDANSHTNGKPGKTLGITDLAEALGYLGLVSCWGPEPDPENLTTFHARTYLQPQLNKAARQDEVREVGDAHCKDHIIVRINDLVLNEDVGCLRDNTGQGPGQFREGMVFPTLDFPSDHAIISCEFQAL